MAIYSWILEHSDIIGLIIDFIALVVSVILTVVIYKLERRHEKEHEAAEEKAQKAALAEAARVFLIDNDDEVDYLPLAALAAKLKLKRKHCRNITTRFMRCSEKQQREILCQANIPDIQLSMDEVWAALEKLQADLQRYEFGRSILYDGAKYLHRAFDRWAAVEIDDVNPYIFEDPEKSEWHNSSECQGKVSWRFSDNASPLSSYIWSYLNAEKLGLDKNQIEPPVDMVFQKCNLGTCDEQEMTFWTMRIIIDACHSFCTTQVTDIFDECLIKTQEDMYYYTLATLCATYTAKEGEQNDRT